MVNPEKKSEFEVQSLKSKKKYLSLEGLKACVVLECQEKVPNPLTVIRCIEPGHGLSGKKKWLTSDDDMRSMYEACKGKSDVTILCYGCASESVRGRQRQQAGHTSSASTSAPKSTRYDSHVDRMVEVSSIEEKLKEKHSERYTDEQLRSWAHLIQMCKHNSYEEPPNKPFFRPSCKSTSFALTVSPGKRINMRGQCVDQLLKSHQLFEKGVISKDQKL